MDGRNNFPKLHNAMWPGLVGKGPDAEPPIGLDTMLDLTAKAEVGRHQVRWRGPLPCRSAHQHRLLEGRDQEACRQDCGEESGRRFGCCAGVAAGRRRLGNGQRNGPHSASSTWCARPAASPAAPRDRHPPGRRRSYRFRGGRRGLGQGPRRQHPNDRRDFPAAPATLPKSMANGSLPRAKSAGAACTAGRRWSICWSR